MLYKRFMTYCVPFREKYGNTKPAYRSGTCEPVVLLKRFTMSERNGFRIRVQIQLENAMFWKINRFKYGITACHNYAIKYSEWTLIRKYTGSIR